MKCRLRIVVVVLFVFLSFSANLLAQTTSSDELRLGVQAYKRSMFEEAIQHFEKCVALAPDNTTAHLYLATAYAQQYIPGVDTPENNRMAEQAIDQYQHVLDGDPAPEERINSAKGIAYLNLQMKKFDDSKKYYRMASGLDLDDPEPYYSMGVIDWTVCYQLRMEERAKLGMKPGDSLNSEDPGQRRVCNELKVKNMPAIAEGIDSFKKALQLRRDYDDAMAYMNLMYREKADTECDDLLAREKDLKTADDWVDRTMATKKAKAEKAKGSSEPMATYPK